MQLMLVLEHDKTNTRAMEGKSFSLTKACLVGLALLSGLQNTVGTPSFDPPQLYPEGLRRSAEPVSAEADDYADNEPAAPAAPAVPAAQPTPNPFLPLGKLKSGLLGPAFDPSQFLQMKADLLKNLFDAGGAKGPVARAVAPANKWATAAWSPGAAPAAWSSGAAPAAPASKWAAKGKPKAPAKPATPPPSPWSIQSPDSAPAAPAPAPASAYMVPPAQVLAPAPAYYAPPPPAPAPGYWIPSPVDKKTALLEALLDQYISPAPASRLARAPLDSASPTPSPYLTDLLDSLNLTLPAPPPTLKPTIEPPGFWFPSIVPAPPGSLVPYMVDPTAIVAKKGKFLSDLFASKAAASAAALAAMSAPTPAPSVAARAVEDEYTTKVAAYLNSILDPVPSTKRAVPVPAPKKNTKAKPTSKPAKFVKPSPKPSIRPINPPVVEEDETPEDEVGLEQFYGYRRKREIGDDSEADASSELDEATVAEKSAAILNDMAIIKQNIILQLDAMSKAESAAFKANKLAAKAAKKASTIAGILKLPPPPPPVLPAASLADFQTKITTLTNLYSTLSDTQKNITSAPDAADPLNADKLFVAAVNAKVIKIMMRNALMPTSAPAPKVARSSNWQKSHGQNSEDSNQNEYGNEYKGRQNAHGNEFKGHQRSEKPGPLIAAVFAPQSYHFNKEPNSWN